MALEGELYNSWHSPCKSTTTDVDLDFKPLKILAEWLLCRGIAFYLLQVEMAVIPSRTFFMAVWAADSSVKVT
jgi:hypothetical protein